MSVTADTKENQKPLQPTSMSTRISTATVDMQATATPAAMMTTADKRRSPGGTTSPTAKVYLLCYNMFALLVWANIIVKSIAYSQAIISTRDPAMVTRWYHSVFPSVRLGMLLALLEIVHATLRIVKSDPVTTAIQVFSRLHIIMIVWSFVEDTHDKIGTTLIIAAWTLSELIRYPFYLAQLMNPSAVPYWMKWLRYSGFLILYPVGILGELLTCYRGMIGFPHSPHYEAWTLRMPNRLNFEFDLKFVYQIVLICYLPGSVHMYSHMLKQRNRALSKNEVSSKQE